MGMSALHGGGRHVFHNVLRPFAPAVVLSASLLGVGTATALPNVPP
jgi:hypothetical protein